LFKPTKVDFRFAFNGKSKKLIWIFDSIGKKTNTANKIMLGANQAIANFVSVLFAIFFITRSYSSIDS
jgi:hypothetical protein